MECTWDYFLQLSSQGISDREGSPSVLPPTAVVEQRDYEPPAKTNDEGGPVGSGKKGQEVYRFKLLVREPPKTNRLH